MVGSDLRDHNIDEKIGLVRDNHGGCIREREEKNNSSFLDTKGDTLLLVPFESFPKWPFFTCDFEIVSILCSFVSSTCLRSTNSQIGLSLSTETH
mmetsp:Transcript_7046/g.26419  ORF Transcript_7046/g.26419 Transcript_7046/m.26419 type:complete len:95 (-) Transcript_7046:1330-1614(-)